MTNTKTKTNNISAWIGNLGKYNEGCLIGKWVDFPMTEEEIADLMKEIEIGSVDEFGCVYEEIFIADYETKIYNLADVLGEYTQLDDLNQLAEALDGLQDWELETLEAALQLESPRGVDDVLQLINDLDEYIFYPGITEYEDLSRMYAEDGCLEIPENLYNYFDFEAYGRDIYYSESGMFTDEGYVVRCTAARMSAKH